LDGPNLYRYVADAPLDFTDPYGTEPHEKRKLNTSEHKPSSEPGEERNWRQDKKLTGEQVKKMQEAGVDPHDVETHKESDLYYDPKTGRIYEKPQGGKGPGEDTGYNVNDF
jgi:hypothetical protein